MSDQDSVVFRCTNCGEEWVDPFTAIIGHSECVPEGEESARVVRVEGDE